MRTRFLGTLTATFVLATAIGHAAITEVKPATQAVQYAQNTFSNLDVSVLIEIYGDRPFSTNLNDHLVQINDVVWPFASFGIDYFYAVPQPDGFGRYNMLAHLTKFGQLIKPGDQVTLWLKHSDGSVAGKHVMDCQASSTDPNVVAECRGAVTGGTTTTDGSTAKKKKR